MFQVFNDMNSGRYVHGMSDLANKAIAGASLVKTGKFQHEDIDDVKGRNHVWQAFTYL
jgi:hypothetical protein